MHTRFVLAWGLTFGAWMVLGFIVHGVQQIVFDGLAVVLLGRLVARLPAGPGRAWRWHG